jgi:predicted nucleic acid-binding protein
MTSVYSTRNLSKVREREIFFDANVLIYIFWPTRNSRDKYYTSAFNYILKQGNPILIDFNIVSEVVNRVFKLAYEKHVNKKGWLRIKEYRNRQEGKDKLNEIFITIKDDILTRFDVVGKGFSKSDIDSFLVVDTLDFNDKGIVSICKENNFVLLTNDQDFIGTDIDILTSNPAILNN